MIVEIFLCVTFHLLVAPLLDLGKNAWKIQHGQLEVVSSACSLRGYRESAVVFMLKLLLS